ncbi:hypothetical protein [Flindersiella endophytica]
MDSPLVLGDGSGRPLVLELLASLGDTSEAPVAVVVADDAPEPRRLDAETASRLAELAAAGGTVYAEFVTDPIGLFPRPVGEVGTAGFERLYVPPGGAGHPILDGFEPLTIFEEHASRTVEVVRPEAAVELLTYGLVAGVGRAVFGPADEPWPALLEIPVGAGRLLYATTALSRADVGQYRPVARWRRLLRQVLAYACGVPVEAVPRGFVPAEAVARLPLRPDRVRSLVDKGMAWFDRAGMLFGRSDGTAGVAEGLSGDIGPDGRHRLREQERADGVVQVAHAYRLYGRLTGGERYERVAGNLMRRVVERSQIVDRNWLYGSWEPRGERRDLAETNNLFADDGGWISLFAMASGHLGAGLRGTESLLRTSRDGLQTNPWRTPAVLLAAGWDGFQAAPFDRALDLSAHWNSSAQSAFCYAYATTGDRRYLDAACVGLDHMLAAYPRLRLETSRTCEMVRLLLPLTGAYRYTGAARYLDALRKVAAFLGSCVDPATGALAEVDGRGPISNASYGTDEASIFQTNDDTVTDQLYALGYAALSLPVAAQVTGLPEFGRLAEQVLDYLSRIQIASDDPLLDGTWMRAFDFTEWDYFGSNCDVGWGPYCAETGWLHAPILIGAMLWLSGEEFWPAPVPAGAGLAKAVRAEFDSIASGASEQLVLTRRPDGRIVRSWAGDGAPQALLGSLVAAADPVWVGNPAGDSVEIYALGEDSGIHHTWVHRRTGEGRWSRLGSLAFSGAPEVRYDARSDSVQVVATGVDGRRYRSALSDPRRGHLPWQEIGHTPFTGVPVYVYDAGEETAVAWNDGRKTG